MSDREQYGLRGAVSKARTEYFDCDQQTGEVSAKPQRATVSTFDADGRVLSFTYENPNGTASTTESTYNERGNLARTTNTFDGKLNGHTVYHYDDAGRLLRVTVLNPDGSEREASRYSYDADGAKTEVRFGLSAAEMAEMMQAARAALSEGSTEIGFDVEPATTTTRYDANGKPLEKLEHDENHILISRTVHTYDGSGLLIETRHESSPKIPDSFPADDPSLGPLEREIVKKMIRNIFESGAYLPRVTYAYDDQGRKTEEVTDNGPFGYDKSTFEYDEHGNEIVVRNVRESREVRTTISGGLGPSSPPKQTSSTNLFRYTYDEHGNWTEKTYLVEPEQREPKCYSVERRTITYW